MTTRPDGTGETGSGSAPLVMGRPNGSTDNGKTFIPSAVHKVDDEAIPAPRNQTEAARMVAVGVLPSPFFLTPAEDQALVDVRVSGSRFAVREQHNEIAHRDPGYITSEAACEDVAGLLVTVNHPATGVLDPAEFWKSVCGVVVFPYVDRANEELRAVIRVLGREVIDAILNGDIADTSPTCVLPNGGGERMALEDGATLLVEAEPIRWDALALLWNNAGVWSFRESGAAPVTVDTKEN